MFKAEQRVRILETAFGDSQEPGDIAFRGQIVTLAFNLAEVFNPQEWAGCWEAETDDGKLVQLVEGEFEAAEE